MPRNYWNSYWGHVDYKSMDRLLNSLYKRNFLIKKSEYGESHIPILNIIEKLCLRFLPIMRRRIEILAEKSTDRFSSFFFQYYNNTTNKKIFDDYLVIKFNYTIELQEQLYKFQKFLYSLEPMQAWVLYQLSFLQ